MTLKLYDSLTKKTRAVQPVRDGQLSVYSCGPTVYSYIHVGNARPFVVAMTLKRHLERRHPELAPRVVVNITDVNEKIDRVARERDARAATSAPRWRRRTSTTRPGWASAAPTASRA